MVTDITSRRIVVAIDGGEDGERALRFGVARARSLRQRLHLLHILPTFVPMYPVPMVIAPGVDDTGRLLLKAAAEQVGALAPDLELTLSLRYEDQHAVFGDETEGVAALILGSRQRTTLRRSLGSTTNVAVASAKCPVFSVPEAWTPGVAEGPVVVAVSHREEVVDLVTIAVEEAWRLGTSVQVLHAWRPPDAYAYPNGTLTQAEDWQAQTERELAEATSGVRADNPDVTVAIKAVYASPTVAVLEAAEGASLVVVGRHHTLLPVFPWLGPVPQAALLAGTAPVMVVPPPTAPRR